MSEFNISIDGQVLSELRKTGIGWCAWRLTEELIKRNEFNININYFSKGLTSEQIGLVRSFEKISDKVRIREITSIKSRFFKLHSLIIPIPYKKLFGSADASCFLNYYVPPFAPGRKICIVYDTVAKAYPDTMDTPTRLMLSATLSASIKRADKIITISEAAKSEIIKFFHTAPDKIVVMPMAADDDFKPRRDGIDAIKEKYGISGRYYMYLGTLEPRKNIPVLIKAYGIVKSSIPDAPKLVISGKKGWGYQNIFSLVKELGLENDVIFTGYLEREEIPIMLSSALAFVFPSIYEGFGMPPLEAMACGCPVITSNVSAMPEIAEDAGILCSPDSPEQFADAMIKLEADEKLRAELSSKGIALSEKYSWKRSAQIFSDTVNGLLK